MVFTLDLKNAAGEVVETAEASFDDASVETLRRFNAAMWRVRDAELMKRGLPTMTNLALDPQQGLKLTCRAYTNKDLYELLHVLRPVMLFEENTSFDRVCAVLKRGFSSRRFSDLMKELRHKYQHGEWASFMQFCLGSRALFHESLLDDWLNGTQYHTDQDKAEAWRVVENSLQTENSRALIMGQISSRVNALSIVQHLADLVVRDVKGASIKVEWWT